MDIQVASQFRAGAVRSLGPRRGLDGRGHERFCQDPQTGIAAQGAGRRCAPATAPLPVTTTRPWPPSRACMRRPAASSIPTPPWPYTRGGRASQPTPRSILSTAHPAKFPDAVIRAIGHRRRRRPNPGGIGENAGKAATFCPASFLCFASSSLLDWRNEVRNIQSFQRLNNHHRPDGRSGKRRHRACGSAPAAATKRRPDGPVAHAGAYGVQGHHHAQRPPDRRRDRSGGRLSQRLYQPRTDRLPCPCAESRCGAGAGTDRRHSHRLDL